MEKKGYISLLERARESEDSKQKIEAATAFIETTWQEKIYDSFVWLKQQAQLTAQTSADFAKEEISKTVSGKQTAFGVATLGPRLSGKLLKRSLQTSWSIATKHSHHAHRLHETAYHVGSVFKRFDRKMLLSSFNLPSREAIGIKAYLKEVLFSPELKRIKEQIPKGNGEPIYLVRGFLTPPFFYRSLARSLRKHGYDVTIEKAKSAKDLININTGTSIAKLEQMKNDISAIHKRTGKRVTVLGHSHGGMMSFLSANECPNDVRRVITLGGVVGPKGPFFDSKADYLRCVYECSKGQPSVSEEHLEMIRDIILEFPENHPHIDVMYIASHLDGFVNYKTATGDESYENVDNIHVEMAHILMQKSPLVKTLVLARMADMDVRLDYSGRWSLQTAQPRYKRKEPTIHPA